MKIETLCKQTVEVPVSEACVHVQVYVEGATTEECGKQAETAVAEVLAEYSENFDNIRETTIALSQLRCVNGDGSVSAEYGCDFVVVSDLANSLIVLNSCCCTCRDNVVLTGWEVYPSKEDVSSAIEEALSLAFDCAKHEIDTIAQKADAGVVSVISVSFKGAVDDNLISVVSLPDVSSDSREAILGKIQDIIPKSVYLSRVVSMSAEC